MLHRSARALALAALAATAACYSLPKAPEPTNPVRFLLLNDVYVGDTLDDGSGGLARVATVRERLSAEGPTLFFLAGDFLSPSLLSKYYSGRQMTELLNAAKLDYATFGNHEFELSRDTLVARIGQSRFKWLSANCTQADGSPFPGVRAWDTVTVAERRIGIFGLTLTGDYRSYVRCADPDSAARRAIDSLAAAGAQFIVALTHQTADADQALLSREPRLDLVLGGHEHDAHTISVGGRYVLKADANARTAQFLTVWGDSSAWRLAPKLLTIDDEIPADTGVQRVVRAWQDSLRLRLGTERVVGTAADTVDARDAVSRNGESYLGDLVTDAMRAGTGADVAILNAGTMRLDDVIAPGPISSYDLESIFLFADETRIVTFPLTGARLRALLEHGVGDGQLGRGGFLQVSGVAFTYDPARPSGSRIVGELRRTPSASAGSTDSVKGGSGRAGRDVIRSHDTLRVAFGVYPACEGGDGYRVPESADACQARAEAPRAADLLARYIEDSLAGRVSRPAAGRIVRRP